AASFTTSPSVTSIHENADDQKLIWTVSATGNDAVVSNMTCPDGLDGRCNETVICNSCTLDNNPDVLIMEGTVINKIVSDPVDEPDDNDRLNYSLKTPPRPSWIHANILFDLDRGGCYQTPNCSNQVILDLKDTHGIDGHESNNSLFQNESPPPTGHFTDFRPTWAQLNWYLDNGNFGEAAINKTSGEIYLTTNISIWPSYPSRNYNMTVTVENTESCYTSTCNMEPLHIASLLDKNEREISLHEDVDEETLLHELKVYDYNYERSSDGHNIEDNATCWIKEVFDQWGDNDTELQSHNSGQATSKLSIHGILFKRAPTIGNLPANVSIHEDENTPLTLFTVETFDSNADDEITCYITNPNDNLPFYEEETFSGSGVYVIKNHVAGTDSSRQLSSAKTTYTIDITCEDRLGVNDTGTLTINVVLNTGPNLTTIVGTVNKQVDQSVVFSGATLLTEEASDQENDALNYTCTVDSTNNPLTCFIEGNIITIQLRRNVSIDRENGLIFSIGVCVGDEKHYNNDCGTLVITFETTHAYPSISNLPATKNVSEGTPIGTVLFTAIVADDDLPNESHVFSIKESYVLLINVTNVNEGNTLTSSVSSINFKESAKVGRKFKTGLSCSDVDHEDTTTISLASGTHVDYFVYNVSDNRLYLTKEWDLDDSSLGLPSTTTLTFRCTDAGGLFSEHDIVVNVEHVNDMKPTFTFTLGESETTSAGKPFLKVS
ncbi:hypothetical protein MAR_018545, partial [Mya arenaria]